MHYVFSLTPPTNSSEPPQQHYDVIMSSFRLNKFKMLKVFHSIPTECRLEGLPLPTEIYIGSQRIKITYKMMRFDLFDQTVSLVCRALVGRSGNVPSSQN